MNKTYLFLANDEMTEKYTCSEWYFRPGTLQKFLEPKLVYNIHNKSLKIIKKKVFIKI